jgi:hypothetical protein
MSKHQQVCGTMDACFPSFIIFASIYFYICEDETQKFGDLVEAKYLNLFARTLTKDIKHPIKNMTFLSNDQKRHDCLFIQQVFIISAEGYEYKNKHGIYNLPAEGLRSVTWTDRAGGDKIFWGHCSRDDQGLM